MSDDLVIIPSNGEGFVELARTRQGRLFRKHILSKGPLIHPITGETIAIDEAFIGTLKRNFAAGVCDIVQVPLANERNEHSEDPDRNIGEVIGIEENGDKVSVLIDARDPAKAEKLGKTYLGASAMLHLDYTDTRTGKKVGPTLLHTCVTNRPYVTGLDDYEEVLAATATDNSRGAVLLTPEVVEVPADPSPAPADEETPMTEAQKTTAPGPTLEDLLGALKNEHHIDVPALQAQAEVNTQAAALSKTLISALTESGVIKLSNTQDVESVSSDDVVSAVAELATNNVALSARVQGLEKRDAEHDVDALIGEGRILPAQRAPMLTLRLSNVDMFTAIVPKDPIVKLNNETGVAPKNDTSHVADIDAEVERLSKLLGTRSK